ncbi:hypothetical protein NC651_027566 [Populus alba x Populus x berolinensis]|nr:hypothetical protein NC651_027566 [Populus alba x Populus x berolinensis]
MASFLIKEYVISELEFGMSSIQKGLLHCLCCSSCPI